MESGHIVIESFEENETEKDSHHYEWYEFNEDYNVPENVITELREHIMENGYELRQYGKIYKYINVSWHSGLNEEQKKEYFLKNLKIGSTLIKQQFINDLIDESKSMIDIIRNLAISHEPVKWEDLPITGKYNQSFTVTEIKDGLIDFKILKLWASFDEQDKCIKLSIITEPPRSRGIIQNHYIGKIHVTQDGKKFKKYCDHCETLKF